MGSMRERAPSNLERAFVGLAFPRRHPAFANVQQRRAVRRQNPMPMLILANGCEQLAIAIENFGAIWKRTNGGGDVFARSVGDFGVVSERPSAPCDLSRGTHEGPIVLPRHQVERHGAVGGKDLDAVGSRLGRFEIWPTRFGRRL